MSTEFPIQPPRPARAGLIRNRLSRRNRAAAPAQAFAAEGLTVAEPGSLDELGPALDAFAREGVSLVVVDGGDGTVREVLTALPRAYGERLPRLAVLASGTTNLIAADVGAGRADPSTVQMLAAIAAADPPESMIQRRSSLKVEWPDGSHPPVHGMFMGGAAFMRATEISMRLVRQGRIDESAGVAATLISAVAQTFAGPERERWMQGEPMRIADVEGARFLFLASTLQKLVLGIWPFWGEGTERDFGVVRYLDVDAPPRRLIRALPAVMRGRPRWWMPQSGYRSGASRSIELVLSGPFVIDGEVFEPGADGRVRLSAGPELEFLVP